MFEEVHAGVLELVENYGALGVLVGMFLESSVVPVPSELVLVSAGALGIPIASIVIFGSIGSTLGSSVGYAIGKYGGRPIVRRYGKYIFVTEARLEEAENWVKKYGNGAVFAGRLIPFVPFKVFSISAGILGMSFVPFITYTFLGTIPRSLILAYAGKMIMVYKLPALIAIALIGILILYFYHRNSKK